MAILVEDGTGIAGSNSYASEDDADDYAEERDLTDWTDDSTGDKEAALIRGTATLDAIYRSQYPGVRANGRDQGLEWPRVVSTSFTSGDLNLVVDAEGHQIDADEIPLEVMQATIELAVRELVTPGSTMPDVDRQIKSVKAGSVSVEFAGNARDTTDFNIVEAIMARLLGGSSGGSSILFGEVSRG